MWVILATNADNEAQVFGTMTGQPFKKETSATLYCRRLEQQYPHLTCLLMPVSGLPPMPNPLNRRSLASADPK